MTVTEQNETTSLETASDSDDSLGAALTPPLKAASSFDELDLPEELKQAIKDIGWTKPTPIQGLCLPLTTQGRDVAGFAQTGTGKTGVFLISIAQQVLKLKGEPSEHPRPHAIVLGPTRELAMQIEADAKPLFDPLGITSMAVFGGIDYDKQAKTLKAGVDVVVATPGRLKDYCKQKTIDLSTCKIFVCDEADRMLDMGFIDDVEFFFERVSEDAQKLLFSATTNDTVKELAFEYLEKPEYISANPEDITPKNIDQRAIMCSSDQKLRVMLGIFRKEMPERSIIFTNTKLVAEWLHYKFNGNGLQADVITGDLPQRKRIQLIKKIKNNEIKALIATDVASRGLHIAGVTHVFNFDLPDDPANYVHRIGRTARAGARGIAVSLVCDDYGQNLDEINALLGASLAPDCEWFDEDYLSIEDKAGDWAAERAAKAESESPRQDRSRSPSGPRERGDRTRQGASASARRHDRHERTEGDGTQKSGKGRNRGRGRDRGRDRDGNRNGSQQQRSRHQSKAVAPLQQPKGVFQWIKRLFAIFFGKSR